MTKPAQISHISNRNMETYTLGKKVEGRCASALNRGIPNPISLSIIVKTAEEAIKLYKMGYLSAEALRESGIDLSTYYNEMQRIAIHNAIQEQFGYSLQDLKRKCRKREIVFPRQLSMYLLEKYTNLTQWEIADMYNKSDHTATIHARNTIIDFMTQIGDSYEKNAILYCLSKYNFEHD